MEFRVLGPLEVRREAQTVELRGSKRRAVLALLVLHANEVVRAERLIEEIWGDHRPANAAGALQNHISRLRKDLGADVLVTKPWGYVLRTQPDQIDLMRFQRLVAEAKPLAAQDRAALLSEALALWRGAPFEDLADEPALSVESARLDDLRLAALEQRIDADLELGRHEELVQELEGLVAAHPLRESLRGQLILALYRSGRQAEALETYRETRRLLVDELGIEPSPELRELELAILRQDPSLAAVPVATAIVDTPPGDAASGWRWPRSPLVVVGLLLLATAGAVAAVVALRDAPAPVRATLAEPPVAPAAPPATTRVVVRTTVPVSRTTPLRPSPRVQRTRSRKLQPGGVRSRAAAQSPQRTRTPKPPVKPAAPAKPRKPNSARPFVFNDAFGTAEFNSVFWHRAFNGVGSDLAQRNGRLEIGLAADADGDGPSEIVEAHYGTNCRFVGDFDVRVEYRLLTWPEASGATVTLAAWRKTAGSVTVSRFALSGGEGYAVDLPLPPVVGPGSNSIRRPSVDDAGALRLRRRDDFLTAYYRKGDSWEAFGGGPYLGNVLIALQLAAGSEFSHQAVRVAFDNFSAEAEGVACSKS